MTLKSKLTTLSVVGALLVTSSLAAFASSGFGGARGEDMYETASTRHLEMTGEELTEEMFTQMQEARELMQSGDKEGAKEIMDELGIKPPKRMGHSFKGEGLRGERPELTDEQKEVMEQVHSMMEEAGIDFPAGAGLRCPAQSE
jgi:hypothetical protein